MTQQEIIRYIDEFLESNDGFVSAHVLDFALDVRSFVATLDRDVELVEAA